MVFGVARELLRRHSSLVSSVFVMLVSISEILKGGPNEIGMEQPVNALDSLNTPQENPQALQLTLMDSQGTAAGLSTQAEPSAFNVEEISCPGQLVLF